MYTYNIYLYLESIETNMILILHSGQPTFSWHEKKTKKVSGLLGPPVKKLEVFFPRSPVEVYIP